MLLCLDIGNTHIFAGVFAGEKLLLRFRHKTDHGSTSDQLGVFLKNVLRENNIDGTKINAIAICSVVPAIDYSLKAACKKYFNLEPFVLQAGVKTGIKVCTKNPTETGADLIAGAVAAAHDYPNKNLIIVDLGTATTITAVSSNKEFLGAAFLPGIRTSMCALQNNAAKLSAVEIIKPEKATGRFSAESIQSGLFYGHIGAIKEIAAQISKECFTGSKPLIIGTGGFANLFIQEAIFDVIEQDLVLHGMRLAHAISRRSHENK